MPREGDYGPKRRRLEAPSSPDSLAAWMRRYLQALAVGGFGNDLLRARRQALTVFLEWASERDLQRPGEVTRPILERYQRHLFYLRKADGQPLTLMRQWLLLDHLRQWFRWLVRQNHLPMNPASDLDLPKVPRTVLPEPLEAHEVEAVLAQPDVEDVQGLRDRAILELLYSTGLRRAEAMRLTVYDLEPLRGIVRVHQGKGRKDRVVPIGERALAWVQRYLDEARPALVVDAQEWTLFLNRFGRPFQGNGLGALVRRYLKAAGITKRGACHLFRHAMATQMLEHGADVRYIQAMLGHENLDTTQVYTHVSIAKLQAVHAATHPGAKLGRRIQADGNEET
ncbi:site-specific tyrosine recombinase XerC [Pseudomarimonas arenosa]|uniref:Site-specific tyrosine recombinase XerC n=1 Tax=Pseudomarimonas arenosa TaxID=2774145 RepID=A0AAW3ZT46_9GAMM|nr:site-specific tyrosine recombinase XerC [Pseudomarimonas arenosa]MBD8528182.1 site-specific tyrosine recombinase XerC [Pseudomarimonas arenosa]